MRKFIRVAAIALFIVGNIFSFSATANWGADYFPNVPLVTHEGETVHFFDVKRWTPIFGQDRGVSKVESSDRFMPRGSGGSSLGSCPEMTRVRD